MFLYAVSVGASLQRAFDDFFAFLPNLLGFLVIAVIAWIVARVAKALLSKGLEKAGFDRQLHRGEVGEYVRRAVPRPSRTLGTIAFWFIFLAGLGIALSQLDVPLVDDLVAGIAAYIPNLVAALLIFLVAAAVSAALGGLVARTMGETPTGRVMGTVVPVLVMAIAGFMILNQLEIAPEIVTITYTALIGAAALALALAFGLGGREVAGRMLQDAYERRPLARRDVEQRRMAEAEARTPAGRFPREEPAATEAPPEPSGMPPGTPPPEVPRTPPPVR